MGEPPDYPDVVMTAMETITQVVDMTAGYRARCEAAGFSPSAAENMAMDFHQYIMTLITNQAINPKE